MQTLDELLKEIRGKITDKESLERVKLEYGLTDSFWIANTDGYWMDLKQVREYHAKMNQSDKNI